MNRMSLSATQALVSRLAAGGYEPLLPAQRAVAALVREEDGTAALCLELDQALDAIAPRRSNGAAFEPLHHHRHPRSRALFQPREEPACTGR